MGAEGVWVVDGAPRLVPGHAVDVVDTVGAGDAFCGSLGARLAAGDDLDAAVVHANAAAALAVMRRGAEPSMPRAEAVGEFLAQPAAAGS